MFKLREQLGIKQNITEQDIEGFQRDGINCENIKPTETPNSIMLMTQLKEFRIYVLLADLVCILFTISNYTRRKSIFWFILNAAFEIPTLMLIFYTFLTKKELKNVLYLPCVLLALRFQLWLIEEIPFFYYLNYSLIEES